MTSFSLQQHVDTLYRQPRQMPLDTTSFTTWQKQLRQKVRELLGIANRPAPDVVKANKLNTIDRGDYLEEKYALDIGESPPAPMYLLIPKQPPPYKPVLVFHGHNPSVQYILGNYPDPETAAEKKAVDNNYAQALAQAGYLVCAVEQRGFGERISDQIKEPGFPTSCRHLSFEYLMQGRTMIGERCWDGMCALTYLQSRDDVVPGIMGCTGNSGGGTTTLWLSAIDDRITVSVPSCYFCSFKHSILGVYHCECNYVPGILQWAEMGDLAALIAPRPLRVIAGEHDPIFPVAGVREQFKTVEEAYLVHNASERVSLAIHPGEHAYNHRLSHEWFDKWLGA